MISGRNILILGAGKEGLASARYLTRTRPGISITLADIQEKDCHVPSSVMLLMGSRYPKSLKLYDTVVVSPGIPPETPLLQTARNITTSTNIFMEDCPGRVIGITGSKGKSTTASLIHHILSAAALPSVLVGNIGNPVIESLDEHVTENTIFVTELSSYQTRLLEKGPSIAVILNLFPEHMDYHGSVEQYYTDKLRITMTQMSSDTLVYNQHNAELLSRVPPSRAIKVPFPDPRRSDARDGMIYLSGRPLLSTSELKLRGEHNVYNVLAAMMVADLLSIPRNSIQNALRTFTPLPHRLQTVGVVSGVTYIDDAISTAPESTIAALQTVHPIGTLIVGGYDRGYDFTELSQIIAREHIPNLVLFPTSGSRIEKELRSSGYQPRMFPTQSMKEAVRFAVLHSPTGSIVLLSCASPSYGVFKNFEDRGDQFQACVRELSGKMI